MYTPDNWVVIKFDEPNLHYRLLTGTSGGYLTGNSWRMNSGIVKVEKVENGYHFIGTSGSVYHCRDNAYCLRMNNAYIWDRLEEEQGARVSIMPEDTDWLNFDWTK